MLKESGKLTTFLLFGYLLIIQQKQTKFCMPRPIHTPMLWCSVRYLDQILLSLVTSISPAGVRSVSEGFSDRIFF